MSTNGSDGAAMIARVIFALWILPAASLVWAHDGINDQWYESLTFVNGYPNPRKDGGRVVAPMRGHLEGCL